MVLLGGVTSQSFYDASASVCGDDIWLLLHAGLGDGHPRPAYQHKAARLGRMSVAL